MFKFLNDDSLKHISPFIVGVSVAIGMAFYYAFMENYSKVTGYLITLCVALFADFLLSYFLYLIMRKSRNTPKEKEEKKGSEDKGSE